MADDSHIVTATVTAQNTGTDWLQPGKGQPVDISIKGLSDSTATLQRRRPGEPAASARDVETYIADAEQTLTQAGQWEYRLFVKSGAYGTDTVVLELNS